MNPSFISSQWSSMCQSAQTSSSNLNPGVTAAAAELMRRECDRFCRIDPPVDKTQLESAFTQRMAVSARLTAIARADAMVRAHPSSAQEVLAEVREFCDKELPSDSDSFLDMQERNLGLTRRIADICESGFDAREGRAG